MSTCGKCGGNDTNSTIYTSNPPQKKCSVCGQFYYVGNFKGVNNENSHLV